MSHVNVHRVKYHSLYRQVAETAAEQSVAQKAKVGAVIVPTSGLLAIGWNGMPSGFHNNCERWDAGVWVTDPRVIHAERNALDKLARQGVPAKGALVFTTLAPCLECAKSLHAVGVAALHYRDLYKCSAGLQFLEQTGIELVRW